MTKSTEIATRPADDVIPSDLLSLATNPAVDPEKMRALVDLRRDMIRDQRQEEFNRDKIAAVMAMPRIAKDGAIKNNAGTVMARYSHWESIDKVIRPILNAHNLALTFDVNQADGGRISVTPILSHVNGFTERGGSMPLAIDTTGAKNATQGAGSAASYGKRHTACAMLNIVNEGADDDGAGAGRPRAGAGDMAAMMEPVLHSARVAASEGLAAYEAFFKRQSGMARGWLIDEGRHENLKRAAEGHSDA